jgi:hypothetical protein
LQEGDATEGVPSESSVPGEPEVIHGAVGARAVRPSPRSVRLAMECSVIALRDCRSDPTLESATHSKSVSKYGSKPS